ncbi:MAG: Rne/Rng family ribonuclease [Deltaproteobacteria bacterium]|nr:Rne/Rng family ribonuclease [Deltaproteobacteria bacterium]
MKKEMLINAVHSEQKRMAILEDGKLVEYNIQMTVREPINGNIYKGIVMKVERGLQAAFVNYGGKKDGFLPLRDVAPEYFTERKNNHKDGGKNNAKHALKVGQEVLVQVLREVSERKGALLTTYISMPGRYLVLLPNKQSSGVSRKIEDEDDRKRLKSLMEQVTVEQDIGFIIRTAGMNRTKQELSRDYQHLLRLWKEIVKKNKSVPAPALIYQESDFGVRSMRDYFTSDIEDIWVDEVETWRKIKAYCKTVAPRNVKMIKLYKEKNAIFDKYRLEDQIRVIYEEQVNLKSGGYIIIEPTEAMITIDVNSGRGSNKKNVEETAFKTNLEAAEEIARQLRLRDLGGLIVIDFIDMRDHKHETEVEKVFKKAMTVDRARIQLARISKFGILELSRQKKQSTIQEISYTPCPFCKGSGVRSSLEYTALTAFRMLEAKAVKGTFSVLKITLPYEISDYLLNMKRSEIQKLEATYDVSIHISGTSDISWNDVKIQTTDKAFVPEALPEPEEMDIEKAGTSPDRQDSGFFDETIAPEEEAEEAVIHPKPPEKPGEPSKKKQRRRPRKHKKRTDEKPDEREIELLSESIDETVLFEGYLKAYEDN